MAFASISSHFIQVRFLNVSQFPYSTSTLMLPAMHPMSTEEYLMFALFVTLWCWSICWSSSRGIWEPLFRANELHDFQPTISMFSAAEGLTDELLYIVIWAAREQAFCYVHKCSICVNACVWGRAQPRVCFFFHKKRSVFLETYLCFREKYRIFIFYCPHAYDEEWWN